MNHLLSIKDLSPEQIHGLIDLAKTLKADYIPYQDALKGKSVVTLFEKPSLRTRVSFDIGINKLGGHCLYLDQQNGAIGQREAVKDFAMNLSRWCDAIVARVFSHQTLEELAEYATVPVVNSLSDLYHPCQGLADFLTLSEHYDDLSQVKLGYIGDGNNVTHSLMYAAAKLGATMVVVCPPGHFPDGQVVTEAQAIAAEHGGALVLSSDLAALEGVDALYADTWISMGDNTPMAAIKAKFQPYQINSKLMSLTGAKYVLHCQPAHREVEITSEVMDSDASLILDQAENRMHIQNAILLELMKD
ncbi:ornithine carbamoyltransferase [Ferrimonas balearica DSM 9799]|uniref:Ornithine carbamoyltransferase n=1 Tax=Ferrimonas balearica (strain DSM 9799 / CCM 4581 / KCTC 23876 / PAT) TaxID=550540 RepID=E1SMH1_FERBD|nr:ornithine carbamoyltransferase [Ferrimonas balearica]ADN74526.1 ornithine carbamoyltransferase [Ferrimonas balearica DSM 9799]